MISPWESGGSVGRKMREKIDEKECKWLLCAVRDGEAGRND